MTDPTDPNSFKQKIPPDLQKQVEEIQKYSPGTTGKSTHHIYQG